MNLPNDLVTINMQPEVEPADFFDWIREKDFRIEVEERSANRGEGVDRFYASVKPFIEVKDGGCLLSPSGNGDTPEEAVEDLAARLSEQNLVVGVFSDDRQEFKAPIFKV